MTPALSVVVCTHNPGPDYLRRALKSLRLQTVALHDWELLLVDNASASCLADAWDLSWHPRARHVREDHLGLTPARLRGITESSGDLVVFVDDDNVLAGDYLEHVRTIAGRFPYLGVFGSGALQPEFEVVPLPELVPHLGLLALRTVKTAVWSNNPTDYACIPWGAGLAVHRPIAERYECMLAQLDIRDVIDRRGSRLFCGGDDLFSWTATAVGLGFGIFPQLRVTHLISARRLTRTYFLRLIHDHAFSHGVLKHLLGGTPAPMDTARIIHVLLHGMRNGLFSMQRQWAASRGESAAARLVVESRLPHVELTSEAWAVSRHSIELERP
jgi:glycosyltransferase involved in cell wall biosynthesis